jgi:hypothetical protein
MLAVAALADALSTCRRWNRRSCYRNTRSWASTKSESTTMDRPEPDDQPVHEAQGEPMMLLLMTTRNRALYHEAACSAIHTLMARAVARGGAWYHYSEGALIIGTSLAIDGGGS